MKTNRNSFFCLCTITIGIISSIVISPVFAQQRQDQTSPEINVKPIYHQDQMLTIGDVDEKLQPIYQCSNYQCTCNIGSDCDEMFDTISIVSCKDGSPGQLSCTAEPRN